MTAPRAPGMLGADGKPVRGGACPECGAPEEKRVDSAGFGAVRVIVCGRCGHHFEGETECGKR